MDKKIIIGFLTLIIVSGIFFIDFGEKARIKITDDYSKFYVNINDDWKLAGTEKNQLFDGTKRVYRDVSNIKTWDIINDSVINLNRFTPYKRVGCNISESYVFDGSINDIELFPVNHKLVFEGCKDLFYRYNVEDLQYDGPTNYKVTSPQSFGYNMEIEFDDGYNWAHLYQNNKLKVQYKIPNDYYEINVRLFDPITTNTSRISPTTAYTTDDLLGYCNVTSDSDIIYEYKWYKNNVSYSEGEKINLHNIGSIDDSVFNIGISGDGTYIYALDADYINAYTFNGTNFTNVGSSENESVCRPWSISINGTYIYVGCYNDYIKAFTFNGSNFTNIGNIYTGTTIRGIWNDGTYIYTADGKLSAYTFNGTNFTSVGNISGSGLESNVWGDGTYIYLADYNDGIGAYTFNGTNFTKVGQYSSYNSYNIWGDGTYIYSQCWMGKTYAYTFNGTDFVNVGILSQEGIDIWGERYIYIVDGSYLWAYSFNGSDFIEMGKSIQKYTYSYGQLIWDDETYIYTADGSLGLKANSIYYEPSIEINVNNISNSLITSSGEKWILSCRGYNGTDYSSWLNSSIVEILSSHTSTLCVNISVIEFVPDIDNYNITTKTLTEYNVTATNMSICGWVYNISADITGSLQVKLNTSLNAMFEVYYNDTKVSDSWTTIFNVVSGNDYFFNVTGNYINATQASPNWEDSFQII